MTRSTSRGARFEAWREGRTGYPFVDAGMRQLLAEGWVHNRVRMVVASFLVKDLHVWWPLGARYFMRGCATATSRSNKHGWQWVAGTGTDPAPFFRIFNPVTQGAEVRPERRLRPALRPRAAHLRGQARRTSRGPRRTATPTATRSASSTTPRSAPRRCAATRRSGERSGAAPSSSRAGSAGRRRRATAAGRRARSRRCSHADTFPRPAVRVRLSAPPPLETPLTVTATSARPRRPPATRRDRGATTLDDAEAPAAIPPVTRSRGRRPSGRPSATPASPTTRSPSASPAARPAPTVCGLRPGPVQDGSGERVAAVWRPDVSLVDADGLVRLPVVWAALDCPGGWSVDIAGRPMVLGTMTAWVHERPRPGNPSSSPVVHWRCPTARR